MAITSLYEDVKQFNTEIIGMTPPEQLQLLPIEKRIWATGAFQEEINEFNQAHLDDDLPGAVDALIDLMYFVIGRMVEMGLSEQQFIDCWEKVHTANMQKKKGNKGRGSDEDAIKPPGWEPPVFDLDNSMFDPLGDYEAEVKAQYEKQKAKYACYKTEQELYDEQVLAEQPSMFRATSYYRTQSVTPEINSLKDYSCPEATFTMADIPVPFQESAELRKKKAADYQSSTIQLKDYFPYGLLSYTQMLHTKMLRLRSLVGESKTPQNESVRDTLLDMMNYACFAIEGIDKGEV